MKRALLIAAVIGLLMVTAADLQARQRRHILPRPVRAGIAIAAIVHAPLVVQHYAHQRGRQVAREIRSNERQIRALERRIDHIYSWGGNYREMRRLEYEIDRLQLRNERLRHRLD